IPTGYSNVVLGAVTTAPVSSARMWSSTGSTSTQIRLSANSNNDRLRAGESVSITFTATNPSTTGAKVWTTAAFSSTSFGGSSFALSGSQPTVTITDCLQITKVADASPVNAGSPIGFTITVTNA